MKNSINNLIQEIMEREEIFKKVKEIIVDKLGVDDECVSEASEFEADFGADSLDAVEMVMEAEKEFGISILDEDFKDAKTVGEYVDMIKKLL